MECSFSKIKNKDEGRVTIEDHEILKTNQFWYLGSIIHKEGEIKEDIIHRIKAWWIKLKSATEISYDRKISIKLTKIL